MSESVSLTPAPDHDGAFGPRLVRLSDLLVDADADARALHHARKTGQARGPVTNLLRLDKEIGGVLLPGVHILHGAPGSGKTAFALQMAASCGCPALYVTCEMRPLVLLKRLTARVTETYLARLSTGEFTPDQAVQLYQRTVAQSPHLALLDATDAPADATTLSQAAETTRRLAPDNPHLLIVLDSLHSWADSLPTDAQEYDRLNESLSLLRRLAARLSCPILAVCERNRVSMAKGGLSAGAGTRKIEYGAETVLDLDAEKDVEDAAGEATVTLKIAKNRNGAAGKKIHLLFHGALQQFREDAQ